MRARLGAEGGFVLISAVILLFILLGLGAGLVYYSNGQQHAATGEQTREMAFELAEAALNAQVGQLSRRWPASESEALPSRCTAATSTATNDCPEPETIKGGFSAYPAGTCATGATEPWGSPLTNSWTTYVRSDPEGSPIFNSATEKVAASYDAGGTQKLWVRAVGVVACHVVSVVTLVSRQLVAIPFPKYAAEGNWFRITNKGKKVIVNRAGEPPATEPGEVAMRCHGRKEGTCEEWAPEKEQISPPPGKGAPAPEQLLSESQLESLKALAESRGTFYSGKAGTCPSSLEGLNGFPTWVEGCGELKYTGGVGNSSASPGLLILADGTLELTGNSEFFGVIYAHNAQGSSEAVVTLHGTAKVWGAIDVDGNGGLEFGSSKANLIYEPAAIGSIVGSAGATPTRNTFRVLPIGQEARAAGSGGGPARDRRR